jgi:protein-disulfide isomerase
MTAPASHPAAFGRRRPFVILLALVAVVAAGLAWWVASSRRADQMAQASASAAPQLDEAQLAKALADAGIDGKQRKALEALVRQTLLDHPEILSDAAGRLEAREAASRLGPLRGALETPFPGAVLGNPQGRVTLVEFTDFACTYCRGSVADVEALVAANPDLKVVVRELPIISAQSVPAARMGLAAAAQGKYRAFHLAMFGGERPSPESIAAAAGKAGLDTGAASAFAARPETMQELQRNLDLARQLGVSGTPAWVAGDQLLSGAVGRERLQQAIDAARGSAARPEGPDHAARARPWRVGRAAGPGPSHSDDACRGPRTTHPATGRRRAARRHHRAIGRLDASPRQRAVLRAGRAWRWRDAARRAHVRRSRPRPASLWPERRYRRGGHGDRRTGGPGWPAAQRHGRGGR